jgi:hypothetical protein
VLRARRIPFALLTGYGVESIDGRFGHVPIDKKPVQRQLAAADLRSCRRQRRPRERSQPVRRPPRRDRQPALTELIGELNCVPN